MRVWASILDAPGNLEKGQTETNFNGLIERQ